MSRVDRRIVYGVVAIMLLAASSCSKHVTHLDLNPDFTAEALMGGGIAIGGVASLLKTDEAPLDFSSRTSAMLERAIAERRAGVPRRMWGDVCRDVGDSAMAANLDDYRLHGSLGRSTIDSVATRVRSGARYLVMARLEQDVVKTDDEPKQEAKEGKMVEVGTVYSTKRQAVIAFTVYDLETGESVASATVTGDESASRTVSGPADQGSGKKGKKGFLDKTIETLDKLDRIFGEEASPYPDPPALDSAIEDACKRFASQLPKMK